MKKKLLLAITSLISAALAIGTITFSNVSLSSFAIDEKPAQLDCSYYFNPDNGYRSLYDLNSSRLSGGSNIANVKTWGTVTCTYYNSKSTVVSQFIQSTDLDGNVGATCLYNINSSQAFPVGSVVSVTGTMTLYNGMSEMTGCSITKDYDSNPSPVTSYELTKVPSTTSEIDETKRWGTREVTLTDVSITSLLTYNKEATATLANNDTITLFFNSISNQTAINDKMDSLNGKKASVKGYLQYYQPDSKFEVLIRDPDNITAPNLEVESITATTTASFGYKGTVKVSDFTITASYSDGTDSVVNNAQIVNNVDTSTLGYKTVQFSYTFNDKTVYTTYEIEVVDTIYKIRVDNPVQYYYFYETFITPTVYGESYYGETDITDEVVFSGFDSCWYSSYNGYIHADYTNSVGKTITDSYEFYVSNVNSLYCNNAKMEFNLYDDFDYPTVYATFELNTSVEVDVSSRVSFSGFDSSTTGEKTITVTLGDYSINYNVDVIKNAIPLYLTVNNPKTSYCVGDSFEKPVVEVTYDDYTTDIVTNSATFTGFDSSVFGGNTITVSYKNVSTTYDIMVEPYLYGCETLGYSSISWSGHTYSTGNYFANGDYEIYRGVKSNNNLVKLLPKEAGYTETLGGSFYNTHALRDIDYIYIKYSTNRSYGSNSPKIYYGENNYYDGYESLSYSTSFISEYIDLTDVELNYFLVDSGDSQLTINEMTIYFSYETTTHGYGFDYGDANDNQYRIAPTVYSGALIDGVSSVSVPVAFDVNTSTVTYKTYKYYSYEYVYNHPEVKSDATMTDPVDVANYFQAFGCAPANYGSKSTISSFRDGKTTPTKDEVDSLFGSNARLVSKYTRTDGYATSVPYHGTTPVYYELDISDGSYSTSNRGSSRVVAWATGFAELDYGNGSQCVCTYTDDHYATFAEYNNLGGFMPRFNAERMIAGTKWSLPITISL